MNNMVILATWSSIDHDLVRDDTVSVNVIPAARLRLSSYVIY